MVCEFGLQGELFEMMVNEGRDPRRKNILVLFAFCPISACPSGRASVPLRNTKKGTGVAKAPAALKNPSRAGVSADKAPQLRVRKCLAVSNYDAKQPEQQAVEASEVALLAHSGARKPDRPASVTGWLAPPLPKRTAAEPNAMRSLSWLVGGRGSFHLEATWVRPGALVYNCFTRGLLRIHGEAEIVSEY